MPCLDLVTSQSPFRNHLGAPTAQLLFHGRTSYRNTLGYEKRLGSAWKDQFGFSKIGNVKSGTLPKGNVPVIKSVATVERSVLTENEEGHGCTSELQFASNLQAFPSPNEDALKMDDRERLRRMKISKANKGNVPWNKGRKHSPETLQRIRERTRLAMQDPKVKMKLINIGHSQSEETRVKIGQGVREGWQRRREKLSVQESCCFEWQNAIAEASRRGYHGEEELQWDSYKILDKQLKKEWLESIEKRKNMPRPKGSKRAPKSIEQRRKISEAISAKWADPEYRERVCSALSKYHGVTVGVERKRRRKTSDETSGGKVNVRKKSLGAENIKVETKIIKKTIARRKKGPTYKDPMASSKLEMIKKIKEQRSEMEVRKREATERARLLIAEAEKAARALEVAALKSPLARASLLETWKLIAEATRSIEIIERGELPSQDGGNNNSLDWDGTVNDPNIGSDIAGERILPAQDELHVNGNHQPSSSEGSKGDFGLGRLALQNTMSSGFNCKVSHAFLNTESTTAMNGNQPLQLSNASQTVEEGASQASTAKPNGIYTSHVPKLEEIEIERQPEISMSSTTKTKKKWVCGRLVEVEED